MCQLEFSARYRNYSLNGKPHRTATKMERCSRRMDELRLQVDKDIYQQGIW